MRRDGVSRDYSMPGGSSGKKRIKGCRMQTNLDNVVVIDVDDAFDNVVVIDIPESLKQKSRASSVLREDKTFPIQGIITIDDDESDFVELPALNSENDVGLDETPSANKPATDSETEDEDADDCQVVLEKRPAFNLSKCKKTYTMKSPPRNRYGLNSDSEGDSCESSSSDCEVLEDFPRELHDQLEKASFNRKLHNRDKVQSGTEARASPSSSKSNTCMNVGVENGTKQNPEPPVSCSENVNFQDVDSSKLNATEDRFLDGGFNRWTDNKENLSFWSRMESGESSGSQRKAGINSGGEMFMEDPNIWCDECQSVNGYGMGIQNEGKCLFGPRLWSIREGGNTQCCNTSFHKHSKQRTLEEHSFPSSQLKPNLDSDDERATVPVKDASSCQSQGEIHSVNHTRVFSMKNDGKFACETSSYKQCKRIGSKEKDKLVLRSSPAKETDLFDTSFSTSPIQDGKNPTYAPGDAIALLQTDIINERENLKQTDEYKRAMEEEWAARQQQLRIQAEEAQRLRKRKKAESLRILDMEKRLKQRVEEVRETQRKDEENLNIKDTLRAEVTKELWQLENTSIDMASLLRGLGIHVGGGFNPLSHEKLSCLFRVSMEAVFDLLSIDEEEDTSLVIKNPQSSEAVTYDYCLVGIFLTYTNIRFEAMLNFFADL